MRDRYMYCAAKLAYALRHDDTEEVDFRVRDLDHWYKVRAVCMPEYGDSFADLIETIGSNFKYNSTENLHSGYAVAPQGVSETIGVSDPETVGWMVLDPNGPALMFRQGDGGLDQYIDQWRDYWLDNPAPGRWMQATPQTSTLFVPYAMRQLSLKERRDKRKRERLSSRRTY